MRGSITPRSPGVWRLTVSHGNSLDGRRRRTTSTVHGTRTDAEQCLARLLVDVDQGHHDAAPGTVRWLGERWWELASPDWTANTRSVNRSALDRHIYPAIGDQPLRRLRTADIDAMYAGLRRKGLGPRTVRRIHDVLRRMLTQAVRWGELGVNPAFNATPPPIPKTQVAVPSREAMQKLLGAAAELDPALGVFVRVTVATGARRAELCALTWADLDLDNNLVLISKALPAYGPLTPKSTKTGSVRQVSIDAATVTAVEGHREMMRDRAVRAGARLGPYVFSTDVAGRTPWHPDSVSHRFKTVARRVDAADLHLHSLRHFNASQLLAAGIDVRTVAGRLGHSQPSTTLDIYAAFVPAADQAAGHAIGAIIDG